MSNLVETPPLDDVALVTLIVVVAVAPDKVVAVVVAAFPFDEVAVVGITSGSTVFGSEVGFTEGVQVFPRNRHISNRWQSKQKNK